MVVTSSLPMVDTKAVCWSQNNIINKPSNTPHQGLNKFYFLLFLGSKGTTTWPNMDRSAERPYHGFHFWRGRHQDGEHLEEEEGSKCAPIGGQIGWSGTRY